jgi:predicted permease
MNAAVVFYEVLILFIIMGAGFIASKVKIIGEKTLKQMSAFIINVTLPVVILMSSQMEFTKERIENSIWLLGMAVAVFLVSIIIANFIFKNAGIEKEKVLKFAAVFSNSAYMGFPLLNALFGGEGVFYGAVFLIPFNIFLWTYGVLVFKKHNNLKQTLKGILTPSMIAMFIAFILIGFSIRIPYPLDNGLNLIGGLTTPLSMIVIGATLASANFKSLISDKWIYIITLVRLLLMPALAFALFFWLSPPDMSLTILVLLVGMPIAAATTIFSEQFGGDAKFASGIVAFSTLLSIGSLPLIIHIFL